MVIELTEPQLRALDEQKGRPMKFVDPRTRASFVLLSEDVCQRLQAVLNQDDDLEGVDVGALIADAMQEDDEDDPLLESYQKYKKTP
jgi:hypothetical protein